MTETTKFINPFYVVDLRTQGERIHRSTIRLPSKVAAFLEGVHGPGGEPTLQVTINLWLAKIYAELQSAGITDYGTDREYEQFVCFCLDRIAGAGSAFRQRGATVGPDNGGQPGSEAPQAHDRRGATTMARPAPTSDIQPPIAPKRSKGKGTGRKVQSNNEAGEH